MTPLCNGIPGLFVLCLVYIHCTNAIEQHRKLVYDNIVQEPCPDGAPCSGKPFGTYGIPEFWKNHPNIHWRCTRPGKLALTFDDGPSIYTTGQVLDKLKELGVKATFFVNGNMINSSTGPLLTRAEKEGHVVASHTYNHKGMANKADWEIEQFLKDEIDATETKANPYLPLKGIQKFIRPPYLQMDDKMATKLADRGYTVVEINIDTNDWEESRQLYAMTSAFTSNMADSPTDVSKNSYIGLQHDTMQRTIAVIEPVVNWAKSKGYDLITIDECVDMSYFPDTLPPSPTKTPTNYPTDSNGDDGLWDNCNGPPCDTYPECRSEYGACGTGDDYCNRQSQWTPWDCNDKPIVQSTKTPTKQPTNGTPSGSTDPPTEEDGLWNNCNGPPCDVYPQCRSQYGHCGTGDEYCNIDSQWTPWDCNDDDPVAESTKSPTNNPSENPTNGSTKSPTNNPSENPTNGSTKSPTNNPSENPTNGSTKSPTNNPSENPTNGSTKSPSKNPTAISTDTPVIDPGTDSPTYGDGKWDNCNGPPCEGNDVCRSNVGECGSGPDYCNINSQWTPWDCKTKSPTRSKWDICTGAPCSGFKRCRSKWGYCGSTDEYCNAEALWTPWDCKDKPTGFLTHNRLSLVNDTSTVSTSASTRIIPRTIPILTGCMLLLQMCTMVCIH